MKYKTCPWCNLDLTTLTSTKKNVIINHIRWCEKNPNRKRKKEKRCPECEITHTKRGDFCSVKCANVYKAKSPEWRRLISLGRTKYLIENPEKHVWKRLSKFKSTPCEYAKQVFLDAGIDFVEEYQPLQERAYSIDIAFPEKKLGIEINGNQHYGYDASLLPYYQKRHDTIEAAGWVLIELHYLSAFDKNLLLSLVK